MKSGAAQEVEAQAAAWLARRDKDGWNEADAGALEAWLEASPHHRVAYLRLANAWRKADRLRAIVKQAPATEVAAIHASRPMIGRRAAAGALIAASLALAVVVPRMGRSEYATPVGGHRIVALADQSRIELNTNSRVEVRYTKARRLINVISGEVYFEMKHDENRPVEVLAGDRRVTMLGTKFMVRHDADQVKVLVTEGRVRVDDRRRSGAQASAVLSSNEMLAASGASSIVIKAPREKIAEQMSWRQDRLTFHQTTLADAAEEFNRYNQRPLVVAQSVAQTRIGGSFDPRNAAAFADLLHAGFGYSVRVESDRIFISE